MGKRTFINERTKGLRIVLKVIVIMVSIVYFLLKTKFKVYDYVVWGDGTLTSSLVHYLSQEKEVLWVIPNNKNISITDISGTDIKLVDSYDNVYKNTYTHFPACTYDDILRIVDTTGLNETTVRKAHTKLLNGCGERFKNCYYYNFENRLIPGNIITKHGIDSFVTESNSVVVRVYFDDGSFVRTEKLVYSDTGNLTDTFSKFWNKSTVVTPKILVGLKNKIIRTKKISFSKHPDGTEISVDNDTVTLHKIAHLATGPPNKLKCVYDNDIPNKLQTVAKLYETLQDTEFTMEPRCFGIGNLCKNFKHYRNPNIICISPALIQPTIHWVRDFLIVAILAKYL